MYITCISHVDHMYITCILHVYHMYITCRSHVYHMYITCILHVYHMYITFKLHVHVQVYSHLFHNIKGFDSAINLMRMKNPSEEIHFCYYTTLA